MVNALLTQIDSLSRRNNVLLVTTSNLTEAIDLAFIDRADVKQFIGLPSLHARYAILQSCVTELSRIGVVVKGGEPPLLSFDVIAPHITTGEDTNHSIIGSSSSLLYQVALATEGFSGR